MRDLRKVSKPTEKNYKLWLNIGNEIIDQYRELYGLPTINKDIDYKDKIRDSASNFREMFALLEAKANKEKLDKQWSTYRSIMIKAFKTLPGPAKDGFKNIIKTKEGLDDAYKTNQTDPERDLTGYEPETSSKSSQDLATWYDKLKNNPEFKKAKIPPPPKEKKNIPTWYDELKNNPEFKKGTIPDPYGQDDAERDLTGYEPEKAKAKRYKQDYVGGVPDEVSNVKTIHDPGREEGWYKNDKKRVQAKAKASSYSAGYGSGDQQYSKGQVNPKVTLKGKMHLNKELPPLSSKTVEDYKKVYRKILRRYTTGTGKGRSYSKVPESSSANSIRQILNILSEAGAKMSSADLEDLTAIENAFKDAEKRKLITPQEVADFAPLISSKEQLTNQLKYDPKKQGNVPDTLKKAMAIKAPGSDTNYGVFNDQVMAVLNNPTPENLIKQAEAVSAMDLDGIDTDRMKFSAFYGHVANAMGLSGMITHRNSFMNSPMVVSAKARKTDFSDKMPEMLPFGEYSVEAVDFDNPRHKAVAQAQLNKNLLPASMQMSRNNTVDDVYKRFGITKQEPQEPEKTGDVSPTVKSGQSGKSAKNDTTDELPAAGQATTDTGQTDRPSGDYNWNALPQAERPPTAKTNKYHYTRFVPLPKLYNKELRLPASLDLFVDRLPRKADGLLGQQLSITDDPKTGKGIEVIHKNYKGKVYNKLLGWLEKQNLSLISKDEAEQFKKQAQHVSADWRGDPGETRDLWSELYGKDAKAKQQAARDRKYRYNNPDGPDSSASFPDKDNLPTASGTWGTDTSYGYQGKPRPRQEEPATDANQRPNYSDLNAPGPNQKTPTRQGPNYSDLNPPLPSGKPVMPDQTPNALQTGDEAEKEKLQRIDKFHQELRKKTTGNAGPPANKNQANQEPNPPTNTDPTSTGDVPERYKIQQITDANGKTQWRVFDSKNALTPVKIVNTEDDAKKVANQLNTQAAKKSGVGSDSSSPVPVDASANNNSLKNVINNAQQQLDQNSTNFTRLLKNAGLLKEFY